MPLPEPTREFRTASLTAGAWDDNLNYGWFKSYRQSLVDKQSAGTLPFTLDERDAANDLAAPARVKETELDVSLVVDTTGSVSDELEWLEGCAVSIRSPMSFRSACVRRCLS